MLNQPYACQLIKLSNKSYHHLTQPALSDKNNLTITNYDYIPPKRKRRAARRHPKADVLRTFRQQERATLYE